MKRFYSIKFLLPAVLILAFLVHATYLFNGFTWLDHNDIESKQAIVPLNQVHKIFITPFGRTAFYRPLVTLLYSIDSFFWRELPFGFHLTNVLLHIIVVYVSVRFLKTILKLSTQEQLTAALIIGVHPAASTIVGSIAHRQESLVLVFIMLTVIFHALFRKTSSRIYGILTAVSYAAALFSKETAIVVTPILIALWEIISKSSNSTTSAKNKKKVIHRNSYSNIFIVEACVTLAYLLLRFRSVPAIWGTKPLGLSLDYEVGTRLYLIFRIVANLVSPLKPSYSDAVQIVSIINAINIFVIIGVLISIYLLVRFGLKSTYGILIIIFALFLAPGLNLIPVPRVGSLHYAYFPLIPFAAGLSIILWRSKGILRKIILPGFIIWVITASYISFISGFQFKNDASLFTPEIMRDPYFLEGHQYLGDYYYFHNDLKKAEFHYKKSLQRNPQIIAFLDQKSVLNNFAGVRLMQNRLEDADMLLSRISNPSLIVIYNHAVIAYKLGDHHRAVNLLRKHVSLWKQPEPLLLLANSLHILGKVDEEYKVLKQAMLYMSENQKEAVKRYILEGKKD